jgi:hypothetical protein
MEANVDPSIPGSRLEADHPEIGVLFARLFTVVLERTGDLVTVKYRDYPQYPPLVRHRSVIALISSAA